MSIFTVDYSKEVRWFKKWLDGFLVLVPMCKDLGSYHSHLHNMKNLDKLTYQRSVLSEKWICRAKYDTKIWRWKKKKTEDRKIQRIITNICLPGAQAARVIRLYGHLNVNFGKLLEALWRLAWEWDISVAAILGSILYSH